MNKFKDLGIKAELSFFDGDKIKINKILNKEISILNYKIEDSKIKEGTKLLTIQIETKGEKFIIFTGSRVLQQMISKVPKDKFPFMTTIIKENQHLEFT